MTWCLLICLAWTPSANKDLVRAIHTNDVAKLQVALRSGADVNTRLDNGQTALQVAMARCHPALANALLDAGADGALTDQSGRNAVHHAAALGRLALLRRLIAAGVALDLQDDDDQTPLRLAVHRGDWPMVRLLIRHGARVGRLRNDQSLVADAILHGHFAIAQELLEAGADFNVGKMSGQDAVDLLHQRDMANLERGIRKLTPLSPLVAALDDQNRGKLNDLLPNIDYQEPDAFGPYPLYLAALFDDVTSFRAMLEQGAHVDHTGALGSPPLIAAVMMGRLDVAAALLDGIEVQAESWLFTSHPLDGAILNLDRAMADLLFAAGFVHISPGIHKLDNLDEILPLDKARRNLLDDADWGVFTDFGRMVKHPDTRLAPIIAGTRPDEPRSVDKRPEVERKLPQVLINKLTEDGSQLVICQLTLEPDGKVHDLQPLFMPSLKPALLPRLIEAYREGLTFRPAQRDGRAISYRDLHIIKVTHHNQ